MRFRQYTNKFSRHTYEYCGRHCANFRHETRESEAPAGTRDTLDAAGSPTQGEWNALNQMTAAHLPFGRQVGARIDPQPGPPLANSPHASEPEGIVA